MMNKESDLKEAAAFWDNGQPLEAGRIIFENLAAEKRPKWAARLLDVVVEWSGSQVAPIEQLRNIAMDRQKWQFAHKAFSIIRDATLELERERNRSNDQAFLLSQLYLAENVAKVIYNATNPPDEFDEDSGCWIARCLRDCVDRTHNDEFAKAAWIALCTVPE